LYQHNTNFKKKYNPTTTQTLKLNTTTPPINPKKICPVVTLTINRTAKVNKRIKTLTTSITLKKKTTTKAYQTEQNLSQPSP